MERLHNTISPVERTSVLLVRHVPVHGAVGSIKMRKAAIKTQMTPLKDWYRHIGTRLPYLVSTKYMNVYVAISRAPPRANVMCLLTGKFGARSSSTPQTIADANLENCRDFKMEEMSRDAE